MTANDPEASLTPDAARAALCACLSGLPAAAALAALYPALLPGIKVKPAIAAETRLALTALAATLPGDQTLCLAAARDGANTIDRLAILAAALLRVETDTLWLHHEAAHLLSLLVETGTAAAAAPCIMHCSLGLQIAAPDSPANPFLRLCLARRLMAMAPREAMANAVVALTLGASDAMDVIRVLARRGGMVPPDAAMPMTISTLRMIEARCQLPPSSTVRCVSTPNAAGIRGKPVTNALTITIPAPPGAPDHLIFHGAGQAVPVPQLGVFALEGGIVSFDLTRRGHTQIYVFDRNRACVEALSWGVMPFIVDEVEPVAGDLAVIEDQHAGTMNICHFLLDHLTRVALYDTFTGGTPRILLADPHDTYRHILARAGLAARVLEAGSKRFSMQAGRLLFASNIVKDFRHPAHLGAPWALNFLRDRFAIGRRRGTAQNRRLFISRTDARQRQAVDTPAVEALAATFGFEILRLAGLTLEDQIAAFAAASCVAGIHGAGFTNILFAPPGLRMLEILPPLVATGAYWRLAHACGHHYTAMVADDPELPRPDYAHWGYHAEYNERDVVIDLAVLRRHFEALVT